MNLDLAIKLEDAVKKVIEETKVRENIYISIFPNGNITIRSSEVKY